MDAMQQETPQPPKTIPRLTEKQKQQLLGSNAWNALHQLNDGSVGEFPEPEAS